MRRPKAGVVSRTGESLARHTAWRTGGPCPLWLVVHRRDLLVESITELDSWIVLGAGTRTVVRDGGMSSAVVRLGHEFANITYVTSSPGQWRVGAAAPMPALVFGAAHAAHTGMEPFASTPGSVGASLALDPGWEELVEEVHFLQGSRERVGSLAEARKGKRLITDVVLRLAPEKPSVIAKRSAKRRRTRPAWFSTAKGPAGRILQRAALDSVRLRGVAMPASAPEMLVNMGGGTADDLQLLSKSIRARVRRERGVDLDTEVRFMGTR